MTYRVVTDNGVSRHRFTSANAAHNWASTSGLTNYAVRGFDDHGNVYTDNGVLLPVE